MNYALLLGTVALLLVSACGNKAKQIAETATSTRSQYTVASSQQGETDVRFPVYDFEGLAPLLHQDDGKTYVINFWATWCKPCVEELPYFERLNAEQKKNNVEVILVSLDMPNMWTSRLEPFVEKKGLQSKVIILDDPKQNDWIPKVAETWGGGIPATLIYNTQKRQFYERSFTYEELNKIIHTFIH